MGHAGRDAHEITFAQLEVGAAGDAGAVDLSRLNLFSINYGTAHRQNATPVDHIPDVSFCGVGFGVTGLRAAQENARMLRRALDEVDLRFPNLVSGSFVDIG